MIQAHVQKNYIYYRKNIVSFNNKHAKNDLNLGSWNMISETLKTIVEKLNRQGKMDFLEGATEEQIAQFEKEYEIRLPLKFKEWLQYSDGGEFFLPAAVHIYGVAHKPLIDVDCDDRPSDQHIVIGALSTGDPILCEKETEQVAIYNHEAGRIEDNELYADFFLFLESLYDLLGIGG